MVQDDSLGTNAMTLKIVPSYYTNLSLLQDLLAKLNFSSIIMLLRGPNNTADFVASVISEEHDTAHTVAKDRAH